MQFHQVTRPLYQSPYRVDGQSRPQTSVVGPVRPWKHGVGSTVTPVAPVQTLHFTLVPLLKGQRCRVEILCNKPTPNSFVLVILTTSYSSGDVPKLTTPSTRVSEQRRLTPVHGLQGPGRNVDFLSSLSPLVPVTLGGHLFHLGRNRRDRGPRLDRWVLRTDVLLRAKTGP